MPLVHQPTEQRLRRARCPALRPARLFVDPEEQRERALSSVARVGGGQRRLARAERFEQGRAEHAGARDLLLRDGGLADDVAPALFVERAEGDAIGSEIDITRSLADLHETRGIDELLVREGVCAEEQGLLGSTYMSEKAKKENWNIEAVLNNDIIGSNNSNETNIIDNNKVRVFSEGLPAFETEKNATNIRNLGLENDGKARQLARYVKETGERYVENLQVVLVYRNERF